LYLLSAETQANSDGIIQGLTDTELSNIGYLQSQALGRYLQHHRFSHIYSSDLKRAAEVCLLFLNVSYLDARINRCFFLRLSEGKTLSTCLSIISEGLRVRKFVQPLLSAAYHTLFML